MCSSVTLERNEMPGIETRLSAMFDREGRRPRRSMDGRRKDRPGARMASIDDAMEAKPLGGVFRFKCSEFRLRARKRSSIEAA